MVLNECTEFSCGLEHPRHEHTVARRLAQGGDDLLPLIEFEANISHVALTYLPLDLVRKISVDHGRSGGGRRCISASIAASISWARSAAFSILPSRSSKW